MKQSSGWKQLMYGSASSKDSMRAQIARFLEQSHGLIPIDYLARQVGADSSEVRSHLRRLEAEGLVVLEGNEVRQK